MSPAVWLSVPLSERSTKLLKDLAARGIYGREAGEVAARFIDRALEQFIEAPKFKDEVRK